MSLDSSGQTPRSREDRIRAVTAECRSRREAGEHVSDEDVIAEHPDLGPELGQALANLAATDRDGDARHVTGAETIGIQSDSPDSSLRDLIPGYRILRRLSEGGQGVVFEAVRESTRRKVAIKMMREGSFASRSDLARFEREVKVLARLNHPNIVAIHDRGTATGGNYFVMDYIAGRSLDDYMQGPDAPGSIAETLRLFDKICSTVNAAHLAGIIHRDLKPSNVRIDSAGEPHILDFGLAKVPLSDSELSMMTVTGQFVGSLPWASPEQAEGIPDKIDLRTDVYSLGVILYQMLTGKFPYEVTGNMRDVLDRVMRAEPRRPSAVRRQINDEVETIVLRCLNKERERRYQSAGELERDVERYLNGEPIEAKRDSFGYVMRKQLMRKKVPVAVGVSFLLVILVGFVTSLTLWRRAATEEANARFRLEAARAEAVSSFEEYQAVIPRLRRAEDLAALLPREVHERYPQDSPAASYLDATKWITSLFPATRDSAPDIGVTALAAETREALKSCAREPARPRNPVASDWVRANRAGVNGLIEATKQHRFDFGTTSEGDLLVRMLLPSLRDARFAVEVLTVDALLHHDEGNHEQALESLRAAMRVSRYVGDGGTTINALAEFACRDMIFSAFRWMMSDAIASTPLTPSYLAFIRQAPPLADYAHAYITEVRVLRQTLNEAFVRRSDRAPARLDLARLHELANEWGVDENPYSSPSKAMIADADTLDYEEAVSIITDLCRRLRSQVSATFREIRREGARVEKQIQEDHPALRPLVPSFTRVLEIRRESQMNQDATVIAVAIRAFRESTGRWPKSIDDALASFEPEPLCREYYGHDFVYRIVSDAPLLYCVGPNGIDDGGHGLPYGVWTAARVENADDDVLFLAPPGRSDRE